MTVEMGRGFVVAFSSKQLDVRLPSSMNGQNRWKRQGNSATAWGCLTCGTRGKDVVIGVAAVGIPASYNTELYGLTVCFWPLDMSAAGYGDGKSMRLGEKACIRADAP